MKLFEDDFKLKDSVFCRNGKCWNAQTLIDFAKAKEYPIIEIPICAIPLNFANFSLNNIKEFLGQYRRVENCSLEYPIILDDYGCIADGYHRVCKAILENKETIKAIRLIEMPAYDYNE